MENQKSKITLEAFASDIVAKNQFIKASFGGFAGSGKTRTASEFVAGAYKQLKCKKPIMIIDNEKGSRFLIPFFKKELPGVKILLKDTTSLADVIQAMAFLDSGEIDFLFIDSLSKVWYKYVAEYKEKNRLTFMSLQDWGKILPAWQAEFSDRFVNINGSISFTGRGGFTYDKEEDTTDNNGRIIKKGQFVKSGVKMKMAGETPFEPDLNIWMELEQDMQNGEISVWREAQVLKDRSGMIDGKIFKNPTYKDFKPVIDFLSDLPTGTVNGSSDNTNLAPAENYDGRNYVRNRATLVSEIEGAFNLMRLGTSKEDKGLKAAILKRIWGVLSTDKLNDVAVPDLEDGLKKLVAFADEFNNYMAECIEGSTVADYKHVGEILDKVMSKKDEITELFGGLNDNVKI